MSLVRTFISPKAGSERRDGLRTLHVVPMRSGPAESSASGPGLASEPPVKLLACRTIFLFSWGLSHPIFSAFTQLSGNGNFSFTPRYATRALCALRTMSHEETIAYAFKKSELTWVNPQRVETRASVQDKFAAMRMISVSPMRMISVSQLLGRCTGDMLPPPVRTSRSFRIEIRSEPPTALEASVFACDIKRLPPSGRSAEISKDVRTNEPSQSRA